MNISKKWFEMPPIAGFDAVKESRRIRDAQSLELNVMTREERAAHFAKVRADHASRRAALLRVHPELVAH